MDTSIAVLVVEDSSTMSRIIAEMLGKIGYADVDVAQDGNAALGRMQEKKYGLVLSDWEMQPMGGEEFVKAMRQNPATGRVPVILITAKSSRGASWLAGANAHLPKPFDERDLKAAINSVMGETAKR